MSRAILLNVLLATVALVDAKAPESAALTKGAPGFADCPEGILCPILPKKEKAKRESIVTIVDTECDEASELPASMPASTVIETITSCPPEVTDCPAATQAPAPAPVCPGGPGCPPECPGGPDCPAETSAAAPVETKVIKCSGPEQCPECSPDVCTPCMPGAPCDICDTCKPACPAHCPPPAASSQLPVSTPSPTPSPSPSTRPVTMTLPPSPPPKSTAPPSPPPTGNGERARPAAGLYLGMAAVFVAVNWL